MKEGGLKPKGKGCFIAIAVFVLFVIVDFGIIGMGITGMGKKIIPILAVVGKVMNMAITLAFWSAIIYGVLRLIAKLKGKRGVKDLFGLGSGGNSYASSKGNPNALQLHTESGSITLGNPFRGVLVLGAAGSGKSESIAVPLLEQFIDRKFAGIVYDFKFPILANDVESFLRAKRSDIRHFFIDFNNPQGSHRVNPLNPAYLPNTSYAREYAQAIIKNLMRESIKKPDFWVRSATDLLTACIWYLREERPDICDLPHVLAMVTSKDKALLQILSQNIQTAQMTISIMGAMERGAEGQLSGVVGTLQGAIAQINTPELMYIFGANDFSLDINDPDNPVVLTIGNNPTLTDTLSPLCALLLTVATKQMNQPHKNQSFVLLDETPTVFVPNLDILPNTGRSNKICTVLMCQDLAQLTDSYGQEKADVLFASCNSHFYGRVATSKTAEILSKQFGKADKIYTTESRSRKGFEIKTTSGQSETIQERDIYKPSVFLNLGVGEFAGLAVESNRPTFKAQFRTAKRPQPVELQRPQNKSAIMDYYQQVRHDIDKMLETTDRPAVSTEREGKREPERERDQWNISY